MAWSATRKISFRFLFLYLTFYCLQPPPFFIRNSLLPVIGRLIGVDADHHFSVTGSGDTLYHYIQVLAILSMALAGTFVWSAADRNRPDYRKLCLGLRVLVRLFLGVTLIRYGAAKVIQSQFPPPDLHRLLEPFGDASPMGLLWTFMGASGPYNVFTGGSEMLAGLLLFFPVTSLLGALISIGVLSHICALNFCYDVPVKLFSTHLLAMGIFLAAGDAGRLAAMFLRNRSVPQAPVETVLQRPILLHLAFGLKLLVLATILGTSLYTAKSQSDLWRSRTEGVDRSKFLLLNRGFHWVSDVPFNR